MKLSINSNSPEQTEQIANKLGKRLVGGELIELISDLGGGKTTFVRGLARGLGSPDKVASPTFTLSRIYQAKKLSLYHFDFYRLSDPGIMLHELGEIIGDKSIVIVIEWAKVVSTVLTPKRLKIDIKVQDEQSRSLQFDYPKNLAYLVEGLC